MSEYNTEERLIRLKAFDRLKALADAHLEAKKNNDRKALAKIAVERQRLKKEFLTVVK